MRKAEEYEINSGTRWLFQGCRFIQENPQALYFDRQRATKMREV